MNEAEEFWENRYAEKDQIWSGKVNQALSVTLSGQAPGTVLDLGCGEGGDSVWLARRGWSVTGVDVSRTALERARRAAAERGLEIDFRAADLATWEPEGPYDLVTACFLHSPVAGFPRTAVLRRAAAAVAAGDHLLVVSHAAPPPWSQDGAHTHGADPAAADLELVRAQEQVRRLELPDQEWEILIAEDRARGVHDPEGNPAVLEDAVVLARRR